MRFDLHVEDSSGRDLIELLLPKILGENSDYRVLEYRGLGRIPRDLHGEPDRDRRKLLEFLPRVLRGYGRTYPAARRQVVLVIVCDLDQRCLSDFRRDLHQILASCDPKPLAIFCFAVEEMEAWLLGDRIALRTAYPLANERLLADYVQDSICRTWERLADVVHPGGAGSLSRRGYRQVGRKKSEWARRIGRLMDVERNQSPSFRYFRDRLRALASS